MEIARVPEGGVRLGCMLADAKPGPFSMIHASARRCAASSLGGGAVRSIIPAGPSALKDSTR
ncbi:hypothetical protein MKK88_13745 [Methylobacterium sp. E-005]|uniref:hypothetical protein n=1 Tax=Methylobacterium sp. E-005 TaxID=2836549 RepID=UPI001FB9615C|nr:hypothetical protein [Methylobacterium sp. E-005]MCJ2087044.1 hypothetical protein [Methylobacterium sp. E-005]